MKNSWFKRVGWIYVPVSVPGVLVSLVALGLCVQTFLAVGRHSHSASDTLYSAFPFFTCCFLLVDWVARRTNSQPD
jgi:hypothetical protein